MKMFLSSSLAIFALYSNVSFSAPHEIDPSHSSVNFKIRHLFTKTTGQFKKFTGKIDFSPDAPLKARFDFTVNANSINTDNEERDKHLRSKDFFWVEKHPLITFKSQEIIPKGKHSFLVKGLLSIRGVSKVSTVKMNYLGQVKDPWGTYKAGFEALAKVNRKDFGLIWNKNLDSGGVILGDQVDIEIFLETINKSKSKN